MRPETVFDPMLQHERTVLAWERTAISSMVAGLLLARFGAREHILLGVFGVAQVLVGAALLVWTGVHYEELHGVLRAGHSPANPRVARLVGISATLFTGVATILAIFAAVT